MWSPTDRLAGISAILGGVLWAVTPLRQPVFGAGRTPEEGELFFRAYNGLIVVVVVLLTAALLRHRAPSVLLSVAGVPEDYLGLPLTVLYGGAWVVLGLQLCGRRAGRRDGAVPNGAAA